MKRALEALQKHYEREDALAMDPIAIPRRYADPLDRELAAWVAAHLAYGRVAPMLKAIEKVMSTLGSAPANFLRTHHSRTLKARLSKHLTGWVWRFHTADDIVHWILAWKRLDQESGERGLEPHLSPDSPNAADAKLSALVQRLRIELPPTHGLRFTLPDPQEGSACKRWRLFLRWMVRNDWPDLGLWSTYPSSALIIPLDTHVARIAGYLGLSHRRAADGKTALEITEALRRWDPVDPLKYDFALSHLGIMGDCPGVRTLPTCKPCPLVQLCRAGR